MVYGHHLIRLVCGKCGIIACFRSWEEALDPGWDTIERFGYNACDRCPGVSVYLPMLKAQEARAAREGGRPEEAEVLLAQAAELTTKWSPDD